MSDEELTRLLSELNETAQKLNDALDSINQTISSIEQKIVASNVGIEYWLGDLPVLEGDERHWQAFSPSTTPRSPIPPRPIRFSDSRSWVKVGGWQ